jgi:hypothetical protein
MALPKYLTREHCQFLTDMRKADRKVFHFEGVSFWKGPAVSISNLTELQDLCYETRIRLKYEATTKGYTVHPEIYGEMK